MTTATAETWASVYRYQNSLRSGAKQLYAAQYVSWRRGIRRTEPARPASLSYMAAQSVRIHVDGIIEG